MKKQIKLLNLWCLFITTSLIAVSGCSHKTYVSGDVFSLYGDKEPDAGLGKEKDIYLNTSNGDKYLKTFKGWYRVGNINRIDNIEHKYKISSETYSIGRFIEYDDFQTLSLIKWAGFDCYDYSIYPFFSYDWTTNESSTVVCPFNSNEYENYYQELRRFADDIGLMCNQVHTPYPIESQLLMDSQQRSLHVASILGGEVAAIHPMIDKTEEENVEAIRKLIPTAEEYNVKIGLENMSKYTGNWFKENGVWIFRPYETCTATLPESLLRMIEALDSNYVGGVVDIGHAFLYHQYTDIPSYFTTLGNYVIGIHIQDGDNQHDSHLAPFTKDINMKEIADALLAIQYNRPLTLEAINSIREDTLEQDVLFIKESISLFRDMMENPR